VAEPWSAREDGRALLAAVTQAIAAERAKGRVPSSADLARAVLRSPALRDANRKLLDDLMAEYEPKLAAAVAAEAGPLIAAAIEAERERISRLVQAEIDHLESLELHNAAVVMRKALQLAGLDGGEQALPVAAEVAPPELEGQLALDSISEEKETGNA
jgi:hypothetical protein